MRASGGAAKSAFWRGCWRNFQKRVVTLETQEGSAYGAARIPAAGGAVWQCAGDVPGGDTGDGLGEGGGGGGGVLYEETQDLSGDVPGFEGNL